MGFKYSQVTQLQKKKNNNNNLVHDLRLQTVERLCGYITEQAEGLMNTHCHVNGCVILESIRCYYPFWGLRCWFLLHVSSEHCDITAPNGFPGFRTGLDTDSTELEKDSSTHSFLILCMARFQVLHWTVPEIHSLNVVRFWRERLWFFLHLVNYMNYIATSQCVSCSRAFTSLCKN